MDKSKQHDWCYIKRLLPYTVEKAIEGECEVENSFNDTSIHSFQVAAVSDKDFWQSCAACEHYKSSDTELITFSS
jgi:hypothetical protein